MKKVNKKKGFTLAELLVVIAILAILVAVAVPIFTGVLGDAEEKVQNANVRAVRAAAVTKILTDETPAGYTRDAGSWTATAKVSATGDITTLEIKDGTTGATEGATKDASGAYDVVAIVHELT